MSKDMSVELSLTKARIQLLLDRCFYGNLALHLKLVKDNSIPTFCTDGKEIRYNEEFAKSLNDKDKQYILCHEIIHNALYHLTRRNNRNQEKWNLAIDYATNSILYKDFGYVPEGGLYNNSFDDLSAEEIYNKLPDMNGKGQKKGNYRRFESKDGKMTIEIDGKNNIKINGEKIKSYDEHKDVGGSKQEIDELEKDWKIQTVKAYEQSKIAGKSPSGFDIFIKELLQPKLNWRDMMKQFMVSVAKSDFRWFPSNRRFIHKGLYLPSNKSDSLGDVVVVIDNSGSTVENQQRFFSECNGLLQQYDMNLHLIVVDMEINDYTVYNKGDEIKKEYKGAGGTDIKIAWNLLKDKFITPSVIVVLTDGYTDLNFKSDYPTLWVVTKNGVDLDKIPFGMKVKIEDD